MAWKLILSPGMAKQVQTKPPASFPSFGKADDWGIRTYGSGTRNVKYKGKHLGWHVEQIK